MSHLNSEPYFSRGEHWSWYIALVDIHKIKAGERVRGYLHTWHTHVRILKNDIHKEPKTEPANECWIPPEQLELEATYVEPTHYCKATNSAINGNSGDHNIRSFKPAKNRSGIRETPAQAFRDSCGHGDIGRDREFDNSQYSDAGEFDRRFD